MSQDNDRLIDELFRTEYGKLVSTLTRLFGTAHIQLAEDVVQEALITALNKWSVEGIPKNPSAWLIQVAKRKALNELKRNQKMEYHQWNQLDHSIEQENLSYIFMKDEIQDSQLRMIFTCCHPSLNVESQIALTLKTLCGFGVLEVANALLCSKATINKRLYRAKASLRKLNEPFSVPTGDVLKERMQTVIRTLYLLFNEGYNASAGNEFIQKSFCLEAIRLSKLLEEQFPKASQLKAFLALMCFHVSRFDARIDAHGGIIIFEDQDRSLWNQDLIKNGLSYLTESMVENKLSAYHLEANIAALHCFATNFEDTDWQSIYESYELLAKFKPNPIIKLNLAIIQSRLLGLENSLILLNELETNESLKNYHLLPATQGTFLFNLNRKNEARHYFQKALKMNPSDRERVFILQKLEEC